MTTVPTIPQSAGLLQKLGAFKRGEHGLAAVEFAAILPFMLVAYLGSYEVGDGVAIDRKVAITARSVADLASRYTNINNAAMSDILNGSASVIAPFAPANLTVTVSQVAVDAQGHATISWSDTLNGTARSVGQAVTLPGTLNTPNTSLVWGEVTYAYKPTLGYVLTGTWNMSNQMFMAPRNSSAVIRTYN
jgi:Flp pilus assembly protein TadG